MPSSISSIANLWTLPGTPVSVIIWLIVSTMFYYFAQSNHKPLQSNSSGLVESLILELRNSPTLYFWCPIESIYHARECYLIGQANSTRDSFSVQCPAGEIAAMGNGAATVLRRLMYCPEKLYNPLSQLSSVLGSRPGSSTYLGIQIWWIIFLVETSNHTD